MHLNEDLKEKLVIRIHFQILFLFNIEMHSSTLILGHNSSRLNARFVCMCAGTFVFRFDTGRMALNDRPMYGEANFTLNIAE